MPDLKISAMTLATQMANADVVPIVQGGANFQCQKQQIFEAAPTENLVMKWASGGQTGIAGIGGGMCIYVDAGGKVQIINPGNTVILQYTASPSGNWAGSAPIEVTGAINRMAALLVTLSGSPIP